MAKFKVGDKVISTAINNYGKKGIVIDVAENEFLKYLVLLEDNTRYWFKDNTMELIESKKKTSNKVINTLLDELGLEAGEKFNIVGSNFNPYHFDENGILLDKDSDDRDTTIGSLIFEPEKIEKLPKVKEMTVAEIEKELGYKVKIVKGGD